MKRLIIRQLMTKEINKFDNEYVRHFLESMSTNFAIDMGPEEFKRRVSSKYLIGQEEHDEDLRELNYDEEIKNEIVDIYLYHKMKMCLPSIIQKADRVETVINEE